MSLQTKTFQLRKNTDVTGRFTTVKLGNKNNVMRISYYKSENSIHSNMRQ